MIKQIDHYAWHKLNGLIRYGIMSIPAVKNNSMLVNEYPKSGGTWLTLMLSDALEMPFASNRLPYMNKTQIFHGHYMNRKLFNSMKQIVLWRDGRDVIVSLYYHALFYNDKKNKVMVDYMRSIVPFDNYVDIRSNLPSFIELYSKRKGKPNYDWATFVKLWHECDNCVNVKYEELFDNCKLTLSNVFNELDITIKESRVDEIIERYSINNIKKNNQNEAPLSNNSKISFIRKGGHGGWRDIFSREAAEVFAESAGSALISLGYESNDLWVENVN
jgi:Sulfotransferase domain